MLTGQANFLQSLGWALLNSLWQMALLWLIYQLITGINKSAKSSFRSSLASFLLITGFAFFIYTFFSCYNDGSDQGIRIFYTLNYEENLPVINRIQRSLSIASVLYLVLLVLPVAHFIRNYRYVGVIRKYGLSKVDVQWRIFIKKVADRIGIKKPVQIWISEFVSSPVTIGFLKPVILVPIAAINNLSAEQMEAVLLHELSHIKRYDYLVNLVINFIQTIFYFNPFVKAFVKIVEREREKSCDEMVMQFQYDSYEYATALLTLEKTNHIYRPLAVGATGKKNDLLKRVELIMGVKTKPALSFNKIAGLIAGLICIIILNALLFIGNSSGVKTPDSFASLSSPFQFLPNSISEPDEKPVTIVNNSGLEANPSMEEKINPVVEIPDIETKPNPVAEGIFNVTYNHTQPEALHLKKYEEAQVKAAMDASKKVLENEEWKALELNIADVFTQKEKDELKATYRKALSKMDWNKWESKLRIAYDQVNWDKVNEQLSKAVNNIRIDSLQNVYNEAISKLDMTKRELSQNNLPGIPDTDITIKTIEETKLQVQKSLNRLKAVRNKKIVHL
jgi:beta-lactamase regulating signal transducer with metallopeptidase domain